MGTVHQLSRLRERKPLPSLPISAALALRKLGIFNMGPIIGFELWGRGNRTSVMMVDGKGSALNASLSASYPTGGFTGHAAARAWAEAYFAGLGHELPELSRRRRMDAGKGRA